MRKILHCYAEGQGDRWEAFCLDFDLAVQGTSFRDVFDKLQDQIGLYVEGVMALPEAERARMLNRRAPLGEWLRVTWRTIFSKLLSEKKRPARATIDYPLDGNHALA